MTQKPVAVGLLLCEKVIVEERTRNVTFVNCFTRRFAKRFPSDPQDFIVVGILTNGLGNVPLEMVIERLDTLDDVFKESSAFRFTNPLDEVRYSVKVSDLVFPVSGAYQAVLRTEGEILAAHRFLMLAKENPG